MGYSERHAVFTVGGHSCSSSCHGRGEREVFSPCGPVGTLRKSLVNTGVFCKKQRLVPPSSAEFLLTSRICKSLVPRHEVARQWSSWESLTCMLWGLVAFNTNTKTADKALSQDCWRSECSGVGCVRRVWRMINMWQGRRWGHHSSPSQFYETIGECRRETQKWTHKWGIQQGEGVLGCVCSGQAKESHNCLSGGHPSGEGVSTVLSHQQMPVASHRPSRKQRRTRTTSIP